MLGGSRVLAYIPARGGSKGVPHKNIRLLGGKPLIAYTIEAALASECVDYVLVSTDSEKIADVARDCGAKAPFLRPAELASDTARTIDGVVHAMEELEKMGERFDIVCVLQPTSPFRDAADIDGSFAFFEEHGRQGLVSVSSAKDRPVLMRTMDGESALLTRLLDVSSTMRRQDMPEYLRVDGAIATYRAEEIDPGLSINDAPIGYRITDDHATEIDSYEDLELARVRLSRIIAEKGGDVS